MRVSRSAAPLLAVAILVGSAPGLRAQVYEERVVARGMVRLHVGGTFSSFDARLGAPLAAGDAARQPLGAPFAARLTSTEFVPLQTLEQGLNQFLATGEGEGPSAGPQTLFLATSDLRTTADHRAVPFGVEVGVLARISFALRSALTQQWLRVERIGIAWGTVGFNPDTLHNRAVLEAVDPAAGALGANRFLPTAGSELGLALQERVRVANTELELLLPSEPVPWLGVEGFAATEFLQTGRYRHDRPGWGLGDTEAALKVQLLNTMGEPEPGERERSGVQSALELAVRFPTGMAPTADYLVLPPPDDGMGGTALSLFAAAYPSPWLGAAGSLRWEAFRPVTIGRRIWVEGDAFPPVAVDEAVRWDPGRRLRFEITPHIRPVNEVALLFSYARSSRSGESYLALAAPSDGTTVAANRVRQQWAIGLHYSTLSAYRAARTGVPFEASVVLRNTFSGSGGAPAARSVELRASIYRWFWGRS